MLALYGTYKAHDNRMKSVVSAQRAYNWTDPQAVLYECPREPRLTFFLVAVMADLVARCQASGNPENRTQSTRLFFRFHTTISQGEQPDHRRVRPSLTIHFQSCKFKAGVTALWLSGSVRMPISLAHRVLTIGRAYAGLPMSP